MTADVAEKVRENRLRRMLQRQGFELHKSRRRDLRAIDFGTFMIVNAEVNGVVYGCDKMSLDEAEAWALRD